MILDFANCQSRLRQIVAVLAMLAAILTVGGAGMFSWMMYVDTAPPFVAGEVYTMNENMERTERFRAGDVMFVHRELCFLRDTPVTLGRTLVRIGSDPVNVAVNTTSGMLRKGCVENSNVVRIPYSTPPGKYRFVVTVRYSNNAFQDAATDMPAPIIEVVR